jgi:hypothetical protein
MVDLSDLGFLVYKQLQLVAETVLRMHQLSEAALRGLLSRLLGS